MTSREREALKALANGPLISATHRTIVSIQALRKTRSFKELKDDTSYRSREKSDPVPFNDDIPF